MLDILPLFCSKTQFILIALFCVYPGCKDDVLFVVDESELMRNTKWTVGNRNGFQRVNDQIVDYLQAVSVSPSPGVAKAGYISLGMDDDDRSAARQVVALNSNLNLVSNAINGVTAQNIGIFWNQVAVSLPKLITAGLCVVSSFNQCFTNGLTMGMMCLSCQWNSTLKIVLAVT